MTDNALARSIAHLTMARLEEAPARSVADITPPYALPVIDDAVDQLTAALTVFCFNQLERSLTLSNKGHEGGTNDFEGELQVRLKLQRI